MNADSSITADTIARRVRRLSIAVWILAFVTAANVLALIFFALLTSVLTERVQKLLPEVISHDSFAGFQDWPVQRQVKEASVIALAKLEREGDRYKCIISEILKHRPATDFFYKVGDEYTRGGFQVRGNTEYGKGQVMFFTGSPAELRYSCSYSGDRILGLGDIPIETLREMIRKDPN